MAPKTAYRRHQPFAILGILLMLFSVVAPVAAQGNRNAARISSASQTGLVNANQERVTLTFLKISDPLEAQAFEEILAAFQQSEGGKWSYVDIQYDTRPYAELFTAIETTVATGAPVDIIQADGPDIKHFAWNNVLLDLTDYFTPEEMALWDGPSIAEGTFNGRFFGPPQAQSCQLLWYNQEMVDAAGLELGTEGLTYGENGTGLPVWQKLTVDENGDGNPEVYGFQNAGPTWYDYLNGVAARTNGVPGDPTFQGVSEDGLTFSGYFDTDEAIEAYKFDQAMIREYKVRSSQPPDNALFSGLSAMNVSQDMILGTLHDQFPDFQMGAMNPPYWQTPLCHTGSWHYGVASNTEHFDEALAFIKFASSDEGAEIMWKYKNQMPANVNLFNSLEEFQTEPRSLIKEFFLEYGQPRIMSPAYTEYNALFAEFYGALVAGGDPEQLAHEYAQLMDMAAEKYRD